MMMPMFNDTISTTLGVFNMSSNATQAMMDGQMALQNMTMQWEAQNNVTGMAQGAVQQLLQNFTMMADMFDQSGARNITGAYLGDLQKFSNGSAPLGMLADNMTGDNSTAQVMRGYGAQVQEQAQSWLQQSGLGWLFGGDMNQTMPDYQMGGMGQMDHMGGQHQG